KGAERDILFNSSAICFRPVFKDLVSAGEMSLDISSGTQFRGKIREAREKTAEILLDEESRVILLTSFTAQAERLTGLFKEQNPQYLNSGEEPGIIELSSENRFQIIVSDLRSGFILNEKKIHIFTERDIFGRDYKRKNKFKKTSSRAIDSFIDLREGDYIVHIQHGIGRFKRIEKVEAGGKVRDFIRLEYGDENTLFIPLDQISQIQRYAGGLEHPPLDTLGKGLWKKKLERAKKSVSRLAEELLIAYANRMKLQGYAFPPDSIWQEEFEAEFEYEETPDQISAIEAVKNDLESPRPMDRLICGDVGYGKTEVAIRAAFKVVMSGKKVLFIAPTTILALQHYNTLRSRYENYPIAVDMVSRFRTAGEVRDIISRFNENKIDILVGTHALLNSKTDMKNLGLLIIDEEQRFGVNQKESFKKYKNMVDVLTLSATPIPRTLHMSLTGIRDLSIIETPPKNRQSVETYVMDEDEEIIAHAVRRELERGGQVFYLHNRVASIETEADYLRNLIPEVSVGILHGQLTEEEVEETIMDFTARKYDVLVTTTIIESGIDMPNVNTIMVKRADMFGLSQLYQIRGRVGRAGRKAYAYLFYPKDKSLTEQAEKRLSTIHEYQELGSGFKVAMRDLEIRGAGNLLGKEQSGNIMEIGFELYV
ncbi:MAG TPA: transcription-repair coupling factor, partial [Leptospiraceae bacterium]|nr:transcription-repair coupling factor [Leptospiraceae bacterium]